MKKTIKAVIAAFLTAVISIGCLDPTVSAAEKKTKKTAWDYANEAVDEIMPDDYVEEYPNLTYDEWKAALEIPEETLTGERLKEFLPSEQAKQAGFLLQIDLRTWLDPLSWGEVKFSEPFRIPVYREDCEAKFDPVIYQWYTAIFQNDKLCAMMGLTYQLDIVLAQQIEYLPYDLTERIDKGEKLSLYKVIAEVDGQKLSDYECLYYNIDKSGKSTFVNKELYLDYEVSNLDPLKTTKADYDLISGFNVLSKGMKKVYTAKNRYSKVLRDGTEIMIANRAEKYHDDSYGREKYKSKRHYIVHLAGEDENGEMMYKLSTISDPEITLKFAGSDKFYFRMSSGSMEPLYKICPASDTDKALTLTGGKLSAKKWTGAPEQQWLITIMD